MKLSYALLLLLLLLGVPPVAGQSFTEVPLTAGVAPAGITAGPEGNVWFTEYDETGYKIGRITPEGVSTEFHIPTGFAHPLEITTGPDGNLWFTENRGLHQIARISISGEITELSPLVLGAGLTNVEVTLRVVDTLAGSSKTYINPWVPRTSRSGTRRPSRPAMTKGTHPSRRHGPGG